MKQIILSFLSLGFLLLGISCNNTGFRYTDLNTGKRINIITDSASGQALDSVTRQPVFIYYDSNTRDTIYGKTGKVINNQVTRSSDGKYTYIEPAPIQDSVIAAPVKAKTQEQRDLELLNKYGKYKRKVSKDGDLKIVEGDKKIKVDGDARNHQR